MAGAPLQRLTGPPELLRAADAARYTAKRRGKGTYEVAAAVGGSGWL